MFSHNNGSTTAIEQSRLNSTSRIESGMGGARLNSAFVSNISEGVTDDIMERLLNSCGPVVKWRRVLDAANMPKSFGFCEFGSADALERALNLLQELPLLGGKKLALKVDDATQKYLVQYKEALIQDSVANSSKEADSKAIDLICEVLKEKNYYSGLEAMDKKRALVMAEEPEEGEAISEDEVHKDSHEIDFRDNRDRRRSSTTSSGSRNVDRGEDVGKFIRNARSSDTQLKAYNDRLSRWEAREVQMQQRRTRIAEGKKEQEDKIKEEVTYATNYLEIFDDFAWVVNSLDRLLGITRGSITENSEANVRLPDFYANRVLWNSRRLRDCSREEDLDKRDEENEKRDLERQLQIQIEQQQIQAAEKRARPTAAEFINNDEIVDASSSLRNRRRKPLIVKDYTKEELLASGYTAEEASVKLAHLYKEKVTNLIGLIPEESRALFDWPIDWTFLDSDKMLGIIKKKVANVLDRVRRSSRDIERITQSLMAQIQQHSDPETIVEWVMEDGYLIEDGSRNVDIKKREATVFVSILWRYLIFETESAAYKLFSPSSSLS